MREKNKNKANSINTFFRFTTIFPMVYFVIFAGVTGTFSVLYAVTLVSFYLHFLMGFIVGMVGLYVIYLVYTTRVYQSTFVRGLYLVTDFNYKNIANGRVNLIDYPNNTYSEFITLNKEVEKIRTGFDKATLIAGNIDFSHINLHYIDQKKNVISFYSFKNYLEEIIFSSQNYRNVIIELYYVLGDDTLNEIEIKYLLNLLRTNFNDYKDVLYILKEDRKSIYIYLPRINSLSKIKEQLEIVTRNASVNKRTQDGIVNLLAHFAVVCYPFSDVSELLSDLQFAKREDKIINVYLPNRIRFLQDNRLLKNSMNLNAMTKLIQPLQNANLGIEHSKKNMLEVQKVISDIATYFALDYAGIISYDEIKRNYSITYQVMAKGLTPLSSKDNHVEKEFVQSMDQAKDKDNSYYFAFRSHATLALGRHLDRVGLESGFFYVLKDGDLVVGTIYFFNKKKSFFIDSYIQEAFTVLCDKIAAIILGDRRDKEVEYSYQEIDTILKITEHATYRVSHDEFTILRASNTMKALFPKLQVGEKCYKTLYGLDFPCEDCPLLTGNKKVGKFGRNKFETSLILSEINLTYHVMTMKNIHQEESQSRYVKDLVINSYSSLIDDLTSAFAINGKGYLLLLRIDNIAPLLDANGSEGYLAMIRSFIRRLKAMQNNYENIYLFNNQAIAMLFTEFGQNDIFEMCEKIYELSRDNHANNADYDINLTYLPFAYPGVFTGVENLLRQAEQFLSKGKYAINKNSIYLDEGAYSRPANKNDYLLSIIETSVANKSFNVNLQPMVNAGDKRIFGAELLLRMSDSYRNTVLKTNELVAVAAQNNKISVISNALLDYIAAMYQQFGNSIFKLHGFQRLSINTDYSFFDDYGFYTVTKAHIDTLKLPNNFLAFEINESDIADHREEFKTIVKQLSGLHIVMVCDQYTGKYLSPEAVKSIGFHEIKLSRNLLKNIDNDRQRLDDVKHLMLEIKNHNMRNSLVGVENIDQYLLIKEIDNAALIQGYYFYRPLEKQNLIDTIRLINKLY